MLKTFSIGGVHPHENKLSAHQPIITAEVPAKAVILLGQHIGAPAKPVVAKGDVVKVGTRIAEPAGFVSAAIHSSVSGKVAKIDTIVDASGYAKPAIFIDVEGDEWEETNSPPPSPLSLHLTNSSSQYPPALLILHYLTFLINNPPP